jgi:hypothetical protein
VSTNKIEKIEKVGKIEIRKQGNKAKKEKVFPQRLPRQRRLSGERETETERQRQRERERDDSQGT